MKVFISWSGQLSKVVAERFRTWLRRIIPVLDPFVSSQDIDKGDVWLVSLFRELEQSSVGIICVTRDNLHSDWLLFEAGALARHIGRSKVCTLLIDVSPVELEAPLSGFQATTLQKSDVLRLMRTIHASLEQPLLSDQELADQFDVWWPELESHIRDALVIPIESRTEIQQIAEELLLPVIYREAFAGEIDTVFHWLQIAKRRRVADLEGNLAFVEACLARITGKRGAVHSLRQLSLKINSFGYLAHLEWLFLQFAADRSLDEIQPELTQLDAFPEPTKRTASALVGLWHIREEKHKDAERYLDLASPERVSGDANDLYRAIPLGILCFALGEGVLGEKHFDLAKAQAIMPSEGYPFISLLGDFDRAFVNACIAHGSRTLPEKRIREFKGYAWVLARYADVLRRNKTALQSLVMLSSGWNRPLQQQSISARMLQFQKGLIAHSGFPIVS